MFNVLEIDSINKNFGNKQVLTDIYLKCITGDIIGLLGRNGTGKSTLLKIMFGSEAALNKFIRIDGKVYNCPYSASKQIAYLPQDSFLPKHLTVSNLIKLFLGKDNFNHFSDDTVIAPFINNKVSFLSGGELRYLEIKLLLTLPVKFVLLDEPFNGISPVLVESLKQLIRESSTSKGIILTDHDYRNVLDIANTYRLLYDGGMKIIQDRNDLIRWGYLLENS